MNKLLALLILLLATAVMAPKSAQAEDRTYHCTEGYLVGVKAMAGDYLDRIGAVCIHTMPIPGPWELDLKGRCS